MESKKLICSFPECFYTDQQITCDGPCGRSFHVVCVGLLETDLRVIASSTHILWVCDICRELVRSLQNQTQMADWSIDNRAVVLHQKSCEANDSTYPGRCSSTTCIYTDKFVCCDGKCGESFHAVCVKLTETDVGIISSVPNLVWFCTSCANRFRILKLALKRIRPSEEPDKDDPKTKLQILHNRITTIIEDLDAMSPIMPLQDNSPVDASVQTSGTPTVTALKDELGSGSQPVTLNTGLSKSKEVGENPKTSLTCTKGSTELDVFKICRDVDTPKKETEPVQGDKNEPENLTIIRDVHKDKEISTAERIKNLFNPSNNISTAGKAIADENNNSPGKYFVFSASPIKPVTKEIATFFLWLAYFESDTTEDDIDFFVRKRMKLSRFETLKVSKFRAKRASFKIEMDARLKPLALNDATWPRSLPHHREFIFHH